MLDINNQQFKKLKIALDLFLKEKKLYLDNAPMKSSMPGYSNFNKAPKLQYTMLKSGLVKNTDDFLERFLIEPLIHHYNMGYEGTNPKKVEVYTDFIDWLHSNKKTEELEVFLLMKFNGHTPNEDFLKHSFRLICIDYPSKLIEMIQSSQIIKMIYPKQDMLKNIFRTVNANEISLVLDKIKDNGDLKTLPTKKFLEEVLGQSVGFEKLEPFEKYFKTRKLKEEITNGVIAEHLPVLKIDLSKKVLNNYCLHKYPSLKVDSKITAGEVFLGLSKLLTEISKDKNKKEMLNIHNVYMAGGGAEMILFLAIKDNSYGKDFYELFISRAIDDFYEQFAVLKNARNLVLDAYEIFSSAKSQYERGELGDIFKDMVNKQVESAKITKSLKI